MRSEFTQRLPTSAVSGIIKARVAPVGDVLPFHIGGLQFDCSDFPI